MGLLLLGHFRRGAYFLNFRASAAGDVLKPRFDDHVALLAQSLEILAQGGFHARAVELVHDFISDFREGLFAFVVVLEDLENQVALLVSMTSVSSLRFILKTLSSSSLESSPRL